MTEQEKKEKLSILEKKWAELYRKKRRYNFFLEGINAQMKQIEEEIKNL